MAQVSDLLAGKDRRLISISPQETVLTAAVLMNDHKIGALLVLDEGRLIGIFTERDILARVVAQEKNASTTLVEDVMTRDVVCSRLHTSIEEARGVMKHRRVRHLPVMDENDQVLGLVSIGDLNAFQANAQEQTIYLLQEYIHGYV